eukprot:GDKH01000194.1.p2 GENE.GDKH01000194.1~~GDKH01000194.1.p2  ORF type:complete len:77 (+),score=3.91 GDKH01000194.1:163-393(+)
MAFSETAMKWQMLLLKHPKRLFMRYKLQYLTKPEPVTVQIGNRVFKNESSQQTVLDVAIKNKVKIPNVCRAGICWT